MIVKDFNYRRLCTGLIMITLLFTFLSGCSGDAQKTQDSLKAEGSKQPGIALPDGKASEEPDKADSYWLIEVSDTKEFDYNIPADSGGTIGMTVTLNFIAWKEGGEDMLGQYEGRALVAFNMDLSDAGSDGITYAGGVMEDSISDNISFEILPAQQETVSSEGDDIDLAPLVKFVGQSEILTDEYTISQQAWQALADGEVKLDVQGSFGDGEKVLQGFNLKAGEDSVLISIGDFAAAYDLDAFSGTIIHTDTQPDPLSWYRDKVMTRMEERLEVSEQYANQQTSDIGADEEATSDGEDVRNIFTVDSEGREGVDTDDDGKLEMYFDEDGTAWADFDKDGKYEIAGEDGTDSESN